MAKRPKKPEKISLLKVIVIFMSCVTVIVALDVAISRASYQAGVRAATREIHRDLVDLRDNCGPRSYEIYGDNFSLNCVARFYP